MRLLDIWTHWLREELRLARLESWSDGAYDGPMPCTLDDPKCQATLKRMAEARERMKRMKAGLLDGRPYTRGADVEETFAGMERLKGKSLKAVK
jgi:hypothetical protein